MTKLNPSRSLAPLTGKWPITECQVQGCGNEMQVSFVHSCRGATGRCRKRDRVGLWPGPAGLFPCPAAKAEQPLPESKRAVPAQSPDLSSSPGPTPAKAGLGTGRRSSPPPRRKALLPLTFTPLAQVRPLLLAAGVVKEPSRRVEPHAVLQAAVGHVVSQGPFSPSQAKHAHRERERSCVLGWDGGPGSPDEGSAPPQHF